MRDSSACPVCGEKFENWAEKNRHHWKVHVKQDIRPAGTESGKEAPMTDDEYKLYLRHFELDN